MSASMHWLLLTVVALLSLGSTPMHAHGLEIRPPVQLRRFFSTITTTQKPPSSSAFSNNFQKLPAVTTSTATGSKSDVVRTKTHRIVQVIRGGNIKAQTFLQNHPFASAVIITTVNAVAADLMAQLVLERSGGPWNMQRTILFGAFGFVFQGFCQYAIVNWGWERLFPGTSQKAVVSKVCGMNLISDPLFFFPAFYLFKQILLWQTGTATVVVEGSGRLAALASLVSSAMTNYKVHAWADWKNSWMVWFPGHIVTYKYMPPHKRIPWMAFLSFFYMCVLSLTRGGA